MAKNLAVTFGGAAAMLSLAGFAPAQVVLTRRDSATVQRLVILPGRMDSIMILASRIAREPYGSPVWIKAARALDSLLDSPVAQKFGMRGMRGGMPTFAGRAFPIKGWVGLNMQGPAATAAIDSTGARRVRYFGYQDIVSVDPGSPAERAGIKPGDVLVAYNGTDLIGHEFNLADMLVPKKHVDLSVRREGDVKEYSLVVAPVPEDVARRRVDFDNKLFFRIEVPGSGAIVMSGDSGAPIHVRPTRVPDGGSLAAGGLGGQKPMLFEKMVFFSPNGLFGASLSNVSEELSRLIKVQKGVLVNSVPEDTPAFRAGLRMGDVIVLANDDSVTTVGELRDLVIRRIADRSVALQVVRQQKMKKLTVSWDSP